MYLNYYSNIILIYCTIQWVFCFLLAYLLAAKMYLYQYITLIFLC